MSDSGMLFCVAALMIITPIFFAGSAWWIISKNPLRGAGAVYLIMLCTVSLSALLFAAMVLIASSSHITQVSVFQIAKPNFYVCGCIVLLCLIKLLHTRYQALLAAAASLVVDWLIIGSLH